MSSIGMTSNQMVSNWFTFRDGCGILKEEHKADFSALLARTRQLSAVNEGGF